MLVTTDTLPIPMVVLDSGPCAGKSTILTAIAEIFDDHVLTVPEAATQVLTEQLVPLPDPSLLDWCEQMGADDTAAGIWRGYRHHLQDAVLKRMIELETAAQQLALEDAKKLIVVDRGAAGVSHFHPDGPNCWAKLTWARIHRLDAQTALSRYHSVILLESLAVHHAELYERYCANNPVRGETVREAVAQQCGIRAAWGKHPHCTQICNFERDLDEVTKLVQDQIEQILDEL